MIFWDKRELLEVKNAIIEKNSEEGLESKFAEIPQKVAQKSKKKKKERKKERKLENQPRKLSISIKEFHQ